MDIRRATADEWDVARDIRLRSLRESPDAFCSSYDGELGTDEAFWRDRLSRSATFLAWENSAPVGTVAGKVDEHEEGSREFVAMWVDPSKRGAGVGKALIEAVADWAHSEGARAIALWVADANFAARRLYERCGFALTGEREPMRPGVEQLRMRKSLA